MSKEFLKEGLDILGLELSEQKIESFFKYKELVLEWNKRLNLTAICDDKEFVIKHFLDSLTVLKYLGKIKGRLIDVGTGAGFPGIPLKIAVDNLDVSLLDSLEKRVKFLDNVINDLDLKNIHAMHSRAEDAGNDGNYRESYDFCVARAVASLPVLCEYCLPFVKVNGLFLAMKALKSSEIDDSKRALEILGGKVEEVIDFTLPFTDNNRKIIMIRKFRQTPTKYPRKSGKPSKNPLI